MLGCGQSTDPRECLKGLKEDGSQLFPETSGFEWSKGWNRLQPASPMRFLAEVGRRTAYWIRPSPDGRFIGLSKGIFDLEPVTRGLPLRSIATGQPYDPAFFPDGSGINYAGGNFCPLSLLLQADRTELNFNESGCSQDRRIGLYQSLGSSLNGTDLLAVAGPFSGDGGSTHPESTDSTDYARDSRPNWYGKGTLELFPMVFNGEKFEVVDTQSLSTPFDGDWQLGPSGSLIVSRVAGEGSAQEGFQVHRLDRKNGSDEYALTPRALFCGRGGKATFSFDERYLTYHHALEKTEFADYGFDNADAPGFRAMVEKGVSNIFVHDLVAGRTFRVTTMNPGQFALFPSFRSDGWLYFLVKDPSRSEEYIVASAVTLGTETKEAARFEEIPLQGSLSQPVFIAQEPGSESTSYWVVEKTGAVRSVSPSSGEISLLLDVSTVPGFTDDGEQGLLGMALDPDFSANHFAYFYESSAGVEKSGNESLLVRYRYDSEAARFDPESRKVLFHIPQEDYSNHKGGMIAFGPDRHLYVATGDGGSGGDPHGNAQNKASLLGKMLRFQITGGELSVPSTNPFAFETGSRAEIWAYGLRNPWRFSFDRETGQLWAGDVGQNRFEEIDVIQRGGNYGWKRKEGNQDYANPQGMGIADYVAPVWTYGRGEGYSVIGGYVYRGGKIPAFKGRYLFGDYGSSKVWVLADGVATEIGRVQGLVSFGETRDGELLAVSILGKIFHLN